MTVAQLTRQLTQEEMISWAAFFQLKSEEEEKAMERAKRQSRSTTMGSR